MTGVTDMPFRRIVKRYGAGLTVTEMIASQAMIRETRQSLQKRPGIRSRSRSRCSSPAARRTKWPRRRSSTRIRGAAIIDINMGCPVKKIVNGEAGSALMRDLKLAARSSIRR
jgi:tRNA-dihydrouridine synthase B